MLHYHNAYGHNIYQGGDIPQELPPINLHDPSMRWSCEATWQIKYMQQQLTHWHQTRKGADLQWEAPIFKVTLPFDYVTILNFKFHISQDFFLFKSYNENNHF